MEKIVLERHILSWEDVLIERLVNLISLKTSQKNCIKILEKDYSHGAIVSRWDFAFSFANRKKTTLDEAFKLVEIAYKNGEPFNLRRKK